MSRETDTPSSGPDGRGGAAYPSGTPPYGTPMVSDGGPAAGRAAGQPEERKTETTLTTRIRINIPGSRPIPPVVMRTPVGESEAAEPETAEPQQPGTGPAPAPGASTPAEPAAEPEPAAQEKPTSDWFAPRKSAANKAPQNPDASNATGAPGGSAANGTAPAAGGAPAGPAAPSAPGAQGAGPAAPGRPGGVVGSMKVPGTSRPGGQSGAGLPSATGGPVAPGHGGGTGSFDVTEALAAGPLGGGTRPGPGHSGEPSRDDLPYFTGNGTDGRDGYGAPGAQGGPGGPNGFNGANGPQGPGGPNGPSGPTGGPVTGDGPMVTPVGGVSSGPGVPGGSLSDDTAILTPQPPAPEPPPGSFAAPPHDNVSGHTVTSGIPVVPPADGRGGPFAGGGPHPDASFDADRVHPDGPPPRRPADSRRTAPAPAPKSTPAPKKKGRSKLTLLGAGVIVLAAGAYGAGLLMNHSDVPKGTTVLGVDIGGGTRDQAVKKLDDAFAQRVGQPLKLSVGGTTVTLKPDQAGLQFDKDATVSAAARSDYNPVSVIGSLFGQQRVVQPVMPVDEEKLQAALESAAGSAGSASDGTIRFESGKAVAVYGKPSRGIDVARSKYAVEQAYRTQVETGTSRPVAMSTTTRQPTVGKAEVDRMMKEFAQPAMSARVTLKTADGAHEIVFSPEKSLWKFLRVKAVDGKLVDAPDTDALKKLYGTTFDGVLITRADGQKTPVTVQDVYGALRLALKSTTDRVAVIETDPS
ncbi:hypothetical protein JS756_13995 [Streptomyces actuosus]|uniref:Peptidoglycan binding domain-containing protein n=1 Tax=Streptomyces actuosus TaxID=1885 RepID=A0ABS2VQ11_STRAS|nr:hypothetical protein [Streptomyces actuosus]MBN0045202.1 hypothetical protein [Streptomyces actuosus]